MLTANKNSKVPPLVTISNAFPLKSDLQLLRHRIYLWIKVLNEHFHVRPRGQNWKLRSPEKSITITIFPNDRSCSWTSVSRPTLSSLRLFFQFHSLVFYIKTTSQGFETSRLLPYILSARRQKGNHGLKIDRTILGRLWWADAAASAAEGNN